MHSCPSAVATAPVARLIAKIAVYWMLVISPQRLPIQISRVWGVKQAGHLKVGFRLRLVIKPWLRAAAATQLERVEAA
jgi:hypothetical protein